MKKKRNIVIIMLIVIALVAVIMFMNRPNSTAAPKNEAYTEVTPIIQDIKKTLSGNGTLEPADSYNVTSLVSGDVLQADFEEGKKVEKDSLLYVIDNSAISNNIEQARMTLEQSQINYDRNIKNMGDLKINAKAEGTVVNIDVEVDDMISVGQIVATVRDQTNLTLKVPFIAGEAEKITVGTESTITLSNNFETVTGSVTKVSSITSSKNANVMTKEITIEVKNPGALISSMEGYAQIGDFAGTQAGIFEWKNEENIVALTSGKVSKILVTEGEKVVLNQLMITLSNDTLSNAVVDVEYSIRSSQMSLDKQLEELDDYEIRSPIAGTIVEKNIKAGDTLSEVKILCTVFDMSYLTTELNIDELDISKVKVGSKVEIIVEALEEKVYEGVITRININGSTLNGVTTYPVTVRIDETEGLLPGMNATFEIIVAKKEMALVIPVAAVERGNQVLIYTGVTMQDEGSEIPVGYEYVTVETGISDDTFVEIVSGLKEADQILIKEVVLAKSEVKFGPGNDGGGLR